MSDQWTFVDYLQRVQVGIDAWKNKPHNAKWWKRIDGTPIPNDLAVCIAEALGRADALAANSATPQKLQEATAGQKQRESDQPEQALGQCWHKEIDDEGICKECGAKAAIKLEGMPVHTAQGGSPVDLPSYGNGKGEAAEEDESREQLAKWMLAHSFATGHGDKFADLLNELSWQVAELRQPASKEQGTT